jgi:DNA-binding MarR family transcriptional regulator
VESVPEASTLLLDVYVAAAKTGALIALAIEETGLSAESYAFLSILVDEGPQTPTDLAARTGIALSTVVFRTRKMIAAGDVERVPNPADRRSYLLDLTRDGRARHARARPLFRAARRAVELRLGTSPTAVQAGIVDLVRALDAEIKERKGT